MNYPSTPAERLAFAQTIETGVKKQALVTFFVLEAVHVEGGMRVREDIVATRMASFYGLEGEVRALFIKNICAALTQSI